MNSHLIAVAFGVLIGAPIGLLALGLCVAIRRGDDSMSVQGLLRAVKRHVSAAPSCGCSVCLFWRGDVAEGPTSEVNLANADAWAMAEQYHNHTKIIPGELE